MESTTRVAAAEQSGSAAMGLMKRDQYDKTITETQKAKIARYAAENQVQQVLDLCSCRILLWYTDSLRISANISPANIVTPLYPATANFKVRKLRNCKSAKQRHRIILIQICLLETIHVHICMFYFSTRLLAFNYTLVYKRYYILVGCKYGNEYNN